MTAMGVRGCVWSGLAMACIAVAGCVTPPPQVQSEQPAPGPVSAPPATRTLAAPGTALEERHQQHALAYTRERNWADALVQWELLALLRPDSAEYRDAVNDTRKRIRDIADSLLRAAGQARRQGHLDQAMLLYLRVLNVDRDNATAAQALREIDAERTQRAYFKRPPRTVM